LVGPGSESSSLAYLTELPEADRVITRTVDAIGPVRGALQAMDKAPRVVASHGLPPDANVGADPVLTDPAGEV